jgi:hypothetical protein
MSGSRRRNREELGEDSEDEDEIQYGVRRSRRATSFQHRDSSSLSPAQIMEQEVYYESAEEAFLKSLHVAQLLCLLLTIYKRFSTLIDNWQRLSSIMVDAIAGVRDKMRQIKIGIDRLIFLMTWIRAHGEVALLYAEDLSIYIRRRNRFQPKQFRRISDIDRQDCYSWFGLNPFDLRRLFLSWRIPETFTTSSRHVYSGEECFLIFLFHIIKGTPFTEMARHTFGGDPRCLSKMNDQMIDHLYITFYNKISGTSLGQWIPEHLDRCREIVYDALCDGAIGETEYVDGNVVNRTWILHHFDFLTFRIFGFLDDVAMPSARPGIVLQTDWEG